MPYFITGYEQGTPKLLDMVIPPREEVSVYSNRVGISSFDSPVGSPNSAPWSNPETINVYLVKKGVIKPNVPDGFYCTCVHSCSGRPDTLLLTLSSNRQREYTEYKLLLDMSTGEITDFLKSCSLEKIAKIHNIDVSEDLAWAVIRSSEDEYYLCNINEGSLVLADDLFENEVEACKFLDDNTVYCSSEDGTAWSYELDTGNYTLVFTDDSEIEYLFGTYALRIEDTGATYVVSLKTGQETLVADYCYISGTSSVLSPDNSRILFAKRDDSIEEMGYKEFAVYNIRDGKLTILPRQGYEVRTEIGYGWLDDQRVEVMAMNSKGEYYCYFYKFP